MPAGVVSAEVIVEPDDGVKPVIAFIDSAHQSLDVAMYLLSDRDVLNALEASHRRGVQVRVMLEENPYGTGPGNRAAFNQLSARGIATRWSPSTFRFSHDKYAVADHSIALVGTANWTHSAFVNNREYLIEENDQRVVKQLDALFEADWKRQTVRADDSRLVVSPQDSRTDFMALIGNARQTIHVEAEEIQDSQIESALVNAARRGVTVQVVLPQSAEARDPNAAGENVLKDGGVQVRQMATPFIHAKVVAVDGQKAFIGSQNISKSSLDENREVGILVEDRSTVKRVEDTFNHDWSNGQH